MSTLSLKLKNLFYLSVIIFLVNLFLKSLLISSVPPMLTNDETYYATEAQALLVSGSDVTGQWHPWQLAPANPIYSELTGTTYALGFVLFPKNPQLAIKVVPLLFGSMLPILLGLISYKLFQRKIFFVTTAWLATMNPWIFQFSRMSFDSFASLFFYCLGIVMLLYLKGKKVLWAIIPFFFGFFQYQGHKPLVVPLVFLTLIYVFFTQENKFRLIELPQTLIKKYLPYVGVFAISCLLVIVYLIRLPHLSSAVRVKEFAFDQQKISDEVNQNRLLSLSTSFSSVFENKYYGITKEVTRRFFSSYDLPWLFQHGNDRIDSFAVTQFGFLYALDALLIIVGFAGVISNPKWRSGGIFLTSLVVIGVLPTVLKSEVLWLTFRESFMILGLVLFSSAGLDFFLLQKKKLLSLGIIALYLISVAPFLYHYFYRYPVLATKDMFFYSRVVASYMKRQPETRFVIYSNSGKTLFDSVLVYNQLITRDSLSSVHDAYLHNDFKLGNVNILGTCFDAQGAVTQSGTVVLVDYRVPPCEGQPSPAQPPLLISSLIDSGGVYKLYGDTLCAKAELHPYMHVTENVFDVEHLSNEKFCESFVNRPK